MKKSSVNKSNTTSSTAMFELPKETLEQLDELQGAQTRVEYLVQHIAYEIKNKRLNAQINTDGTTLAPIENTGINPHSKRNLPALEKAYGGN